MASTRAGVFYQLWQSTSHGGDLADLQGMKMIDFPSEATKRVTTIRILKVNMGDSTAQWLQSKSRCYTSLREIRASSPPHGALWATYYRTTQQREQDTFRFAQRVKWKSNILRWKALWMKLCIFKTKCVIFRVTRFDNWASMFRSDPFPPLRSERIVQPAPRANVYDYFSILRLSCVSHSWTSLQVAHHVIWHLECSFVLLDLT